MENLKVGQSFEVVRIEKEIWLFESDFIVGKNCLGIFDKTKPHGLICKSNAHNLTN